MNVVFLSPHFPPNFYSFCVNLRQMGAKVLGLADEAYESLRPELKNALNDYYRVADMHSYDELLRACGHFTHRHGKIDRIDSQNEYWLETEARLRTDFNIFGIKNDEIGNVTLKARMKEIFTEAGLDVAKGRIAGDLSSAKEFVREVGYPVIVKPNRGVGAEGAQRINNKAELERFFESKSLVDYIIEEFIIGDIYTFDGLTNRDGDIVFYTSHTYSQGILETARESLDIYYYSLRELPMDLEEAGRKAVRAFNIRERFFHIEFFRTIPKGGLIGIEINVRPPGGFTMDMFNYANDIDLYEEWANVVINKQFSSEYCRPYHCCYVGRKSAMNYVHSHEEIMNTYGEQIVFHEGLSPLFSLMGEYGYLVRSSDQKTIFAAASFIQEKRR